MKTQLLFIFLAFFLLKSIPLHSNNNPLEIEIHYTVANDPVSENQIPFSLPIRWENVTDYDFDIEWNNNGTLIKYKMENGIVTAGNTESIGTNTDTFYFFYPSDGLRTIRIYGPNFPGFDYEKEHEQGRSQLRRILKWGDVTWQSMEGAFYRCKNMTIENNAGIPSIPNSLSMHEMFRESSIDQNGNLNNWDVSNVTDMSSMFREAENFNQDISNWNPENVTDMSFMFYKATTFNNGENALTWGEGTKNVENMRSMFAAGDVDDIGSYVSAFNQDISSWNVSKVTRMDRMFLGAKDFNNGGLPIVWNTEKVETMTFMFYYATSFDQNLGSWNIGSIRNDIPGAGSMEKMFEGVTVSLANFEATLLGWDNFVQTNNKPLDVTLHGGYSRYCDPGRYARMHLESKGWNIEFHDTGGLEVYAVCDPDKFVMMWSVEANQSITIPTVDTETYQYKIYWGDESTEENVTGSASHTYTEAGTYPIKIEGVFPRIDFSINDAIPHRTKLKSIENWGTIQWKSMEKAFYSCLYLTINNTANSPDLSQVTNTSNMFYQCVRLDDKGNIGDWNVSTITNMRRMFRNAQNFDQDLSSWDVSNVTNMNALFSNAHRFNNGGVPLNWGNKTSKVTDFTQTFHNCWAYNQPMNDWDVSEAILMTSMFSTAHKFNQPLDNWDVRKVTKMDNMFSQALDFNQNLSDWETDALTTTYWMFKEADDFNNGGVPFIWGESAKKITIMEGMFSNAKKFNQPITWNISSVENFKDMFSNAIKFNQNVSDWDVSSAKNMYGMFFRAYDFNNGGQPLNWGDKTQDVTLTAQMFYEIPVFNQPIVWNIGKVTNMDSMLKGCTSFNQDISSWDVSKVVHMSSVFFGATAFNQDINAWNVERVQQMQNLFRDANSFDQDISSWNVSNILYMNNIFRGAKLSTENYDKLLEFWSQKVQAIVADFHGGDSKYCNQTARDNWEALGWTIIDGGLDTDCTLSINNASIQNANVYPNPFSQTTNIVFKNYVENASIELYNLQGKLVKVKKHIQGDSFELSREGLSNGVYLLRIYDKNSFLSIQKVIIK